jgi:hypothetical protein
MTMNLTDLSNPWTRTNKTTKTIMKRTKKKDVDDDTFTVDIKELRTELNKIAEKYFTPVPVECGIRYVPIKNKRSKSDVNEKSVQDHPFFE